MIYLPRKTIEKEEEKDKKEYSKRWKKLDRRKKFDRHLAISSYYVRFLPERLFFDPPCLEDYFSRRQAESVKEARARFSGTWRAGREQGRTV